MQGIRHQVLQPFLLSTTRAHARRHVICGNRIQCFSQQPSDLRQDIKSVPIRVFIVGKQNSPGAQKMAEEWMEKLNRYMGCSVPPMHMLVATGGSISQVLKSLMSKEYVVVLDERGKDLSTPGIVKMIAAAAQQSSGLAFCIGGPYGHCQDVRNRADVVVKLSSLVLNHEVARVVLYEQLYRAWTILKGHPYHH